MPNHSHQGSNKALWDYMTVYLSGARAAGRLSSARDLTEVVGLAMSLAALADLGWLRRCVLDTLRNAGSDNPAGELIELVHEARENIAAISATQVDDRVLVDLSREFSRRHNIE